MVLNLLTNVFHSNCMSSAHICLYSYLHMYMYSVPAVYFTSHDVNINNAKQKWLSIPIKIMSPLGVSLHVKLI